MLIRIFWVFADLISLPCFLEEKPEQNDYERKRLQNIRDMAKEKKKFKANLKASAKALKQALKRKSQANYFASLPLIKCDFCKRSYKRPHDLEKHKRIVHKFKQNKIKSDVYFECNIQTGLGQGTLGIDKICLEKFKTYDMIKEHIAQNHTFTCSACNESFKSKYKEKIHNCFPFKCDCGKQFKTKEDLTAHNCHKCKYCDELFPNASLMNKHKGRHYNHKTGVYESNPVRQVPLNIWTKRLYAKTRTSDSCESEVLG